MSPRGLNIGDTEHDETNGNTNTDMLHLAVTQVTHTSTMAFLHRPGPGPAGATWLSAHTNCAAPVASSQGSIFVQNQVVFLLKSAQTHIFDSSSTDFISKHSPLLPDPRLVSCANIHDIHATPVFGAKTVFCVRTTDAETRPSAGLFCRILRVPSYG